MYKLLTCNFSNFKDYVAENLFYLSRILIIIFQRAFISNIKLVTIKWIICSVLIFSSNSSNYIHLRECDYVMFYGMGRDNNGLLITLLVLRTLYQDTAFTVSDLDVEEFSGWIWQLSCSWKGFVVGSILYGKYFEFLKSTLD